MKTIKEEHWKEIELELIKLAYSRRDKDLIKTAIIHGMNIQEENIKETNEIEENKFW